MLVVPNITNYKPLLFQFNGEKMAHDTREWGLIAKANPYPLFPDVKEPYKNDWADEDGDDEYCTSKSTHYQSMTFDVTFYIKAKGTAPANELRARLYDLLDKMAASGTFAYFDTYTQTGWLKVRYDGYEEDEFVAKHDWARAIFKMKFKVLDPNRLAEYDSDFRVIRVWLRPKPIIGDEPSGPAIDDDAELIEPSVKG